MYFAIKCAGPYTAACLNPIVGIANLLVVNFAFTEDTSELMKYLPAYIFGPLIGGISAASFAKFVSVNVVMNKVH